MWELMCSLSDFSNIRRQDEKFAALLRFSSQMHLSFRVVSRYFNALT